MKSVLQEVVDRIPGSLGAAVVGLDGIAVEKVAARPGFNIDLASAQGINVVKRAAASLREQDPRDLQEISIACRTGLTILRALGSDYYLCVVVGPECIPGQARYEAWKAGLQLQEAIG
jgi:predicted regulator of Ras-like GTPase activity (Roadblock/LC7/MglB family)